MRRWDELTRKQKKHIREMAGMAYERALVAALDNVFASFQKWKRGDMTAFALDEEIHRYHNGTARDLYKNYGIGDPDMAVLIALTKGILKIEELNEDCRSFYQERVNMFRD